MCVLCSLLLYVRLVVSDGRTDERMGWNWSVLLYASASSFFFLHFSLAFLFSSLFCTRTPPPPHASRGDCWIATAAPPSSSRHHSIFKQCVRERERERERIPGRRASAAQSDTISIRAAAASAARSSIRRLTTTHPRVARASFQLTITDENCMMWCVRIPMGKEKNDSSLSFRYDLRCLPSASLPACLSWWHNI